jgi:hypothetical protein
MNFAPGAANFSYTGLPDANITTRSGALLRVRVTLNYLCSDQPITPGVEHIAPAVA